jgi:Glycosyl hydrolases family 2, sugar binding domain/Glycosyl hydrolases family 2/Glycosyl hydrolases family 2, TIM barrel domain
MTTRVLGVLLTGCALSSAGHAQWAPPEGSMLTRWAADVNPDAPWPEYPRPMMVRKDWQNLNGLWDYAIVPKNAAQPAAFDGQILVPYAVESALSGVKKTVGEANRLWYRRSFEVPNDWSGYPVLLHFGAVDWETTVWVNGKEVGSHRGGYDAFSFDITDALKADGPQEVVLAVWDPTDKSYQPRGKQVSEPEGIWYTAVTGIWQTVWVEPVPFVSVDWLEMVPDIDAGVLNLTVHGRGAGADERYAVDARALDNGKEVAVASGTLGSPMQLRIANAKLWSPDSPFVYDLHVDLGIKGEKIDEVDSYFGMRKIALGKDEDGVNRLFLNNEPVFHFGPLDQGWWPDGLYTAATDEALRYDVEVTRAMGFNMARKHVKIEPARWYYHCDQLGLMVWQDMPSGDGYIHGDDPDFVRSEESEKQFYQELDALIGGLGNHPSIVMWVPFNEGWGQFKTNTVTAWAKKRDPSRLVNQASGWTDRQGGDVHDMHRYPGPAMPPVEENRAAVLGEFGGLGWPVEGHLWWNKRNWGYRTYKSKDELSRNYTNLIRNLRPLIGQGLAAAVYTQTSDVEGEVNGLLTYDRAMVKMGTEWLAEANAAVYLPPPVLETIVPTSEEAGLTWRYTTEKPADGWDDPDFKDKAWKEGVGVFGTEGTPGAAVRTKWDTPEVWLRRTFELPEVPEGTLVLNVLHDEDAEIYINGVRAAKMTGHVGSYVQVDVSGPALRTLKPGRNTMAVHCAQTGGGQSIDVGLVRYVEK